MACDAEQWQEVGGVAGVAARRSGDVVAAVETQATPFSQVIFDRRGQSYVLSSRPPPRRLKRASRNRLRFISHGSSPQYRRNENNSLDSRRTRAMPWRAASRTSAIVSRQSWPAPHPSGWPTAPPPAPGRGHNRAGTGPGASGTGSPARRPSPGCGGRAGCPRARSRARRAGSGAAA